MKATFLAALFSMTLAAAHADFDRTHTPPNAERKPKDVSVHGDTRVDDWFWMRERDNPAVLEHLKAENAYIEAVTSPTQGLQKAIYNEIISRIQETDTTVPARSGDYEYYTRTVEGLQYPIHCRRAVRLPDVAEQIILDVNALAKGEKFMSVGHFEVSDNDRLLAYTVDRTGHRDYEVRIKDLESGENLTQSVGVVSSIEWASDNETLVVSREEPDSKRSFKIEAIHFPTGKATPLLEEKDEKFDVHVSRSRDRQWLFLTSESKTTTEVHALPADHPYDAPRLITARTEDHEYHVDHRKGRFYIVTNKGAKNFRICTAPVENPGEKNWTELVAHQPAVKIDDIHLFDDYAAIEERENGLPQIRILDFIHDRRTRIAWPEPVFEVGVGENYESAANTLRVTYQSPTTPSSVFDYDFKTGKLTLLKETAVRGGYDRTAYACQRLFAKAKDGTQIPMTVVFRKNKRTEGPQPLFLYGYGSYGISMPATFSARRLSLLDRGVTFVIAHIRGGGEMGEEWHDQGKMAAKMNTFTDFIACAEDLVARHYTRPELLVANGGSAGGLLMGAVMNLRPDLFRAAIYDVPFVDVLNTMLDDTLPLTTAEYLEWGNPTVAEEYKWMRAYSPYDNVRAQAYPDLLINVSLNDSQVPYWEGAKLAAKIRDLKTSPSLVLLKSNLDAGHGGASGRYDAIKEIAFDYAFALFAMGIRE
ncbi:S9 family peptidase [Nibricoccus sp. IMCC34717]|uniref:S9 family peptidase n=1 Tax=Nibricoccus sp. IMCC34717 TaxID=3034021 RepID=UPI0038509F5C